MRPQAPPLKLEPRSFRRKKKKQITELLRGSVQESEILARVNSPPT